jgi:hypothetical protein
MAKIVSSQIKKYTTLEEMEKSSKGPLFVMNTTSGDLSGKVLISIPKTNGQGHDMIRIPKTFIPVDVTLDGPPRKNIIQATDFRSSIGKGMIKLATREYAELLLNSPEGKEELRKLQNERMAINQVTSNMGMREETEEDEYVDSKSNVGAKAKADSEKRASGKASDVSIKLRTMVSNAIEDDWTETKILAETRNYGQLTLLEIKFLNKKFKDLPRVSKYLRAEHAALTTTADED